ncbi:replication protein A 70 kDa DNA-binding subunit B [Tanacetum coccineum]
MVVPRMQVMSYKVIKSTDYIDLESEVPKKAPDGPNDWWCRKYQAWVSLIKSQRGFPLWLDFIPGIHFRTTNDPFSGIIEWAIGILHIDNPAAKVLIEKFRSDLKKIAMTTLDFKILSQEKEHFANLAVEAVMMLKTSLSTFNLNLVENEYEMLNELMELVEILFVKWAAETVSSLGDVLTGR